MTEEIPTKAHDGKINYFLQYEAVDLFGIHTKRWVVF